MTGEWIPNGSSVRVILVERPTVGKPLRLFGAHSGFVNTGIAFTGGRAGTETSAYGLGEKWHARLPIEQYGHSLLR